MIQPMQLILEGELHRFRLREAETACQCFGKAVHLFASDIQGHLSLAVYLRLHNIV
jgi:hypothetical protein